MSYLFEGQSADVVMRSIVELQKQERITSMQEYQDYTDYMAGGKQLARFLVRHPSEQDAEWNNRNRRFMSNNYVAPLANQIVNGLYGPPVTRTINDGKTQKTFDWIWQLNNMHTTMLGCADGFVSLGSYLIRSWWDETADEGKGNLRYTLVRPQDVTVIARGDNCNKARVIIEDRWEEDFDFERGAFANTHRFFVSSDDSYAELISPDGKTAVYAEDGEPRPNPYGVIPYVHFKARSMPGQYLGLSMIRDAVTIQQEIFNRASELSVTITMQAFSTLVISGRAPEKIAMGPKAFIETTVDGKAYYIQPGAPITEVQDSIEKQIATMFDIGAVPISAIRGGSANSGIQLAIEYKSLSDVVNRLKTQCKESERELFEISLRQLKAHGVPVNAEAQMTPDFPESFLPTDSYQEFMVDLQKLNNVPPLISREDLWKKWNPDLTEQELTDMAADIDGKIAQSRQTRGQIFPPSVFTAKEKQGEEEEETK